MAILLGIDTGGTYTDAVLFDDSHLSGNNGVIGSAKALTTKYDLTVGIRNAISAVLARAPHIEPASIRLVSLSTTLATNAIVEAAISALGGRQSLRSRSSSAASAAAAPHDDEVVVLAGAGAWLMYNSFFPLGAGFPRLIAGLLLFAAAPALYLGFDRLAGRIEQAIEQAQRALAMRCEIGLELWATADLRTLASAQLRTGKIETALGHAQQCAAVLDAHGGEGSEFPH